MARGLEKMTRKMEVSCLLTIGFGSFAMLRDCHQLNVGILEFVSQLGGRSVEPCNPHSNCGVHIPSSNSPRTQTT